MDGGGCVNINLNKENDYKVELTSDQEQFSELDNLIRQKWEEKMSKGFFRYQMVHPECKKLPGKIGYLAQFNPNRVSERRPPQAMMSVRQPFDSEKFNFNKVNISKELVFLVKSVKKCVVGTVGSIIYQTISPFYFKAFY